MTWIVVWDWSMLTPPTKVLVLGEDSQDVDTEWSVSHTSHDTGSLDAKVHGLVQPISSPSES